MSESVTMPALGESVTEGTVTRWLKQVGDRVAVDEPLLEVSTDKVDTEIPSPVAGHPQEILARRTRPSEVGADLAVIGDGSRRPAAPGDAAAAEAAPAAGAAAPAAAASSRRPEQHLARRAAPSSRRPPAEAPEPTAAAAADPPHQLRRRAMPAQTVERHAPRSGREASPRAPSPAGSRPWATPSRSTSRSWRSPPTRSTPRSRPLSPAYCTKIRVAEDETVPVGGDLAVIGGSRRCAPPHGRPRPPSPPRSPSRLRALRSRSLRRDPRHPRPHPPRRHPGAGHTRTHRQPRECCAQHRGAQFLGSGPELG